MQSIPQFNKIHKVNEIIYPFIIAQFLLNLAKYTHVGRVGASLLTIISFQLEPTCRCPRAYMTSLLLTVRSFINCFKTSLTSAVFIITSHIMMKCLLVKINSWNTSLWKKVIIHRSNSSSFPFFLTVSNVSLCAISLYFMRIHSSVLESFWVTNLQKS